MNQKQTSNNPTLFSDAGTGVTKNMALPTSPSGTGDAATSIQAKRGPSKQYIPVYRVELVRERTIRVEPRRAIRNSDDVVAILRDEILKADREKFVCLLLNAKNYIIGMEYTSVGTLASSIICPRELWKSAIVAGAAAIIGIHNHPSGEATPSQEDIRVTERLSKAGEILGIKLLDHIIIAEFGNYSFRNAGRLP